MNYRHFIGTVAALLATSTLAHANTYKPDLNCSRADPNDKVETLLCSNSDVAKTELEFDQAYYALRQSVGESGWKPLKAEEQIDWGKLSVCDSNPDATQPLDPACVTSVLKAVTTKYKGRLSGDALQEASRNINEHIALQQRLIDLGYLPLGTTADGVYGVGMRAAITDWQAKTGQPNTDGFISDANAAVLIPPAAAKTETPAATTTTPSTPASAFASGPVLSTSSIMANLQNNTASSTSQPTTPAVPDPAGNESKVENTVQKGDYIFNSIPIKSPNGDLVWTMMPNQCSAQYNIGDTPYSHQCDLGDIDLFNRGGNIMFGPYQMYITIGKNKDHRIIFTGNIKDTTYVIDGAVIQETSDVSGLKFIPATGSCEGLNTGSLKCDATYTRYGDLPTKIKVDAQITAEATSLSNVFIPNTLPNLTEFAKNIIQNKSGIDSAFQIDNFQHLQCISGKLICDESYIVFLGDKVNFITKAMGGFMVIEGTKQPDGSYSKINVSSYSQARVLSNIKAPVIGKCSLLMDSEESKASFDCRLTYATYDLNYVSYGALVKIPE